MNDAAKRFQRFGRKLVLVIVIVIVIVLVIRLLRFHDGPLLAKQTAKSQETSCGRPSLLQQSLLFVPLAAASG